MRNIVVLDDDPVLAEILAQELSSRRRRIQAFSDPIRALSALSNHRVDLLITDLSMPWLDGKGVVSSARQRQPHLKILLISGYPRGAEIAAAEDVRFLRKPLDLDGLVSAVDDALGDSGTGDATGN